MGRSTRQIVLFSREPCHLCEAARAVIERAARIAGVEIDLEVRNIDSDRRWRDSYTDHIPVVWVDGREAFRHRVDESAMVWLLRGERSTSMSLAEKHCIPCKGGVPPLRGEDLDRLSNELGGGWAVVEEHHLEKEVAFPDFRTALEFTNRVGELAEREGHHPDIHLAWGRVRITIWTHKIDGLTESDFVLAAKIDQLPKAAAAEE